VTDLGTAWAEVGDLSALVEGRHFKRTTGTGGGLLEDQGDVFAGQVLALIATVFGFLQVDGQVKSSSFRKLRLRRLKAMMSSLYICSDQFGQCY
jgi:hypothetical protein